MHDVHVAVPEALADEARRAAELPDRASVQAVIRVALGRLAGWPDSAIRSLPRVESATGGPR